MKLGATKKILVSSVALIAAVGVAAGSTFAWFTSNSTVTVSGFSSQIVSGSDSLTMAVTTYDNTTPTAYPNLRFGQSVTSDQIADVVSGGNPVYLAAVTPKDVKAEGTTDPVYDGTAFETEGGDSVAANSTDSSKGGYVSFRLVFRNRAQSVGNRYIALSADSKIDKGDGKSVSYSTTEYAGYKVDNHLTGGENGGYDNYYGSNTDGDRAISTGTGDERVLNAYAAYAARVAFIYDQTVSATTTTIGKIWAPHEYNLDGSQSAGTSVPGTNVDNNNVSLAKGHYLNNLASDYRLDFFNLSVATTIIKEFTQKAYTNPISAYAPLAERRVSPNLVSLDESSDYTYTSIGINIWLEGTDGDCFDAVLTDSFNTSLTFTVEQDTTVTP